MQVGKFPDRGVLESWERLFRWAGASEDSCNAPLEQAQEDKGFKPARSHKPTPRSSTGPYVSIIPSPAEEVLGGVGGSCRAQPGEGGKGGE